MRLEICFEKKNCFRLLLFDTYLISPHQFSHSCSRTFSAAFEEAALIILGEKCSSETSSFIFHDDGRAQSIETLFLLTTFLIGIDFKGHLVSYMPGKSSLKSS